MNANKIILNIITICLSISRVYLVHSNNTSNNKKIMTVLVSNYYYYYQVLSFKRFQWVTVTLQIVQKVINDINFLLKNFQVVSMNI